MAENLAHKTQGPEFVLSGLAVSVAHAPHLDPVFLRGPPSTPYKHSAEDGAPTVVNKHVQVSGLGR